MLDHIPNIMKRQGKKGEREKEAKYHHSLYTRLYDANNVKAFFIMGCNV